MAMRVLLVSIPGLVISAALLAMTIVRLVRLAGGVVLLRVPLATEQDVDLKTAGPIVLNLESPLLTTFPGHLAFSLRDRTSGRLVPTERALVRTHSSSFTRARLSVQRFEVDTPGTYTLRIDGMAPGADYAQFALVFARPFGLALPLHIVGIVVFAGGLIASIVFTALAVSGKLPGGA
jgi:hypothetical protein